MSEKKYLSGSQAFFETYPDYILHDYDYVIIDSHTKRDFEFIWAENNVDVFKWHKHLPSWYIEYIKNSNHDSQNVAMILTPHVADDLGITIDDIKSLEEVFERLHNDYDGKYDYYRIIWESYIENGQFTLTEEQRNKAYDEYKKKRKDRYS